MSREHGVPRAPVCEVSSHPYLFAYCLNIYHTMHFVRFRHCVWICISYLYLYTVVFTMRHFKWADETGHHALFYTYLNKRRIGMDATKPRTLGLLGHSGELNSDFWLVCLYLWSIFSVCLWYKKSLTNELSNACFTYVHCRTFYVHL